MSLTNDLNRLDEAHSAFVTLIEQGYSSSVLFSIASVLSQVPALDKASNDPYFWQQVILNLNTTADALSLEELKGDSVYGAVDDMTDELSQSFTYDNDPLFDEQDDSSL